ncbi:MAG: ACP S-malonyltransferase [Ruminiclostridium sp.]|nr:ACP S-malonyltransferase [Ruminiclostridium sp.]
MGKIAFVFAGQGAQCPGMGRALAEEVPAARTVFDRVDSIRPGTSAQCFGGTEEELKNTANTQPCLFAVELAAAAALEERGIRADMAAGFSLGELAALTYSRAADLETGFHLVCRRGELMAGDARDNPSAMAAVLKLTDRQVEEVCGGFSEAWPVNYNCPGQVTVACRKETLKPLSAAVKEAGGRALPLRVQGGFHSPFMARAAHAFAEVLAEALLTDPEIPLYSNCTGAPYAGDIRALLARQIESPVRWEAIVRNMIAEGADTFIELGPGRTLCGLIEKIDQSVRVFSMESPEDLNKIVEEVLGC